MGRPPRRLSEAEPFWACGLGGKKREVKWRWWCKHDISAGEIQRSNTIAQCHRATCVTNPAIGIELTELRIGARVVACAWLVGLMLVFVMTDVMGRCFGFVLTISGDRRPGKLERHEQHQQHEKSARHGRKFNSVATIEIYPLQKPHGY